MLTEDAHDPQVVVGRALRLIHHPTCNFNRQFWFFAPRETIAQHPPILLREISCIKARFPFANSSLVAEGLAHLRSSLCTRNPGHHPFSSCSEVVVWVQRPGQRFWQNGMVRVRSVKHHDEGSDEIGVQVLFAMGVGDHTNPVAINIDGDMVNRKPRYIHSCIQFRSIQRIDGNLSTVDFSMKFGPFRRGLSASHPEAVQVGKLITP